MNKQILYIFDPLCGWCYGFSSNILAFSKKYQDEYEFVPVTGGMVTGSRVAPYSEIADYVRSANPRVEVTTGTIFGEDYKKNILDDGRMLTDSEPPSRALITFRTFLPRLAMEYAHLLQKAHFYHGKDYNEPSLYEAIALELGLDTTAYMERFRSNEIKQNVQEEFHWVKESGIQGFPTVVLRSGQQYYQLAHGYDTVENLEKSLERAQKMI